MPTTDVRLARRVLEQSTAAGFKVALLHPLPQVSDGEAISDIDIVWGTPTRRATLREFADRVLTPLGLHLVIAWPYDIGAVSLFALSDDGREGVHLDVVHDHGGRGRLGIRYAVLLENAITSAAGTSVIDDVDRLIYLARKRHWKGQSQELAEVVTGLRQLAPEARRRSVRTLTKGAQRDLDRLLVDGATAKASFHRDPRSMPAALGRVLRRIARPVGTWVHLSGASEEIARELSERLDRVVIHTYALHVCPSRAQALRTWVRYVAPVRWRAGIVLSYGAEPSVFTPDIVVSATRRPLDDVAREVVGQLAQRPGLLAATA